MQNFDDSSNDELVEQLKAQLMGGARKTAFTPEEAAEPAPEPAEATSGNAGFPDDGSDFFAAMNAFRRAKESGDRDATAAAEAALQAVVRAELSGSGE